MSRVFGALLNRISKFKPNAQFDRDSIERFNYAASRFKTIEDLDDRITRDPKDQGRIRTTHGLVKNRP